MSKENAKRFCEEFIKNIEMQEKSKRFIFSRDDLIRFAEKEGFHFTSEDLDDYAAEVIADTTALSDDELDGVTAGLQTTIANGCDKWKKAFTRLTAEEKCESCMGAIKFIVR